MVSEHKISSLGHLIRELYRYVTVGLFLQIRLIYQLSVNKYIAFLVYIDPSTRARDTPLNEELILVVEGYDISRLKIRTAQREHHIPFRQGRRHGCTVDSQNRHPQRRYQDSYSGNYYEYVDRISCGAAVLALPLLALKLGLEFVHGKSSFGIKGFAYLLFHLPLPSSKAFFMDSIVSLYLLMRLYTSSQ